MKQLTDKTWTTGTKNCLKDHTIWVPKATSKQLNLLQINSGVGDTKLKLKPIMCFFPPQKKDEIPFLDFSPLQNAVAKLEKISMNIDLNNVPSEKIPEVNRLLAQAEQQLTNPEGLPGRGWYKHSIYAPGFYTGYGVKTLPGIREGIEQENWEQAGEQIKKVASTLINYCSHLEKIIEASK